MIDDYFRNSRSNNLAFWSRPHTRYALGYANRSRKGRRPYGTVLGIIGVITAGFFWTLGIIKWWEIWEKWIWG